MGGILVLGSYAERLHPHRESGCSPGVSSGTPSSAGSTMGQPSLQPGGEYAEGAHTSLE